MGTDLSSDFDVLTEIITSLKKLDTTEAQKRTLQAVATFLGTSLQGSHSSTGASTQLPSVASLSSFRPTFSEDRTISPKEFMHQKAPRTDIERVVCLAYYLTHYRDTPHFKTLDISTLNTDAAQPKFSNTTVAFDNATQAGLLVQATKGFKQISAAGEVYVQLLPDRDAAKAGIQGVRQKRKPRKSRVNKTMDTKE